MRTKIMIDLDGDDLIKAEQLSALDIAILYKELGTSVIVICNSAHEFVTKTRYISALIKNGEDARAGERTPQN